VRLVWLLPEEVRL